MCLFFFSFLSLLYQIMLATLASYPQLTTVNRDTNGEKVKISHHPNGFTLRNFVNYVQDYSRPLINIKHYFAYF